MNKARLAIVGCGNFAEHIHLPSLRLIKEQYNNFELTATCDLDINKAAKFAAGWIDCHPYDNVKAMLLNEKLDGVLVYTNENATCVVAREVLAAGIPCLLEKPPAKTVRETRQIIKTMESTGTFALAAFNRRHAPSIVSARAFWHQHVNEKITFISCDFYRHNRKNEDFSTCLIHGIDAVSFLADSLYCNTNFEYQEHTGYTDIIVNGIHRNGVVSRINCLPAIGILSEQYILASENFGVRIFFNGGRDETGFIFYHNGKESSRHNLRQISESELLVEGGFVEENLNFIETIRGIIPINASSMSDAVNAVAVSEAIRNRKHTLNGIGG
jgi:predicted dehydrogenase